MSKSKKASRNRCSHRSNVLRKPTVEGLETRQLMAADLSTFGAVQDSLSAEASSPRRIQETSVDGAFRMGPLQGHSQPTPGGISGGVDPTFEAPTNVGTIAFASSTGVLEIVGSGIGDTVTVADIPQTTNLITGHVTPRQLEVQFENIDVRLTRTFDYDSVSKIVFHGEAGDDSFTNLTSIPTDAFGGQGDDVIEGGSADDYLEGNLGDDVLVGGDGEDILVGGAGADELYGKKHDDVLDGGAGNDYLEGNLGNDLLVGGEDADEMLGGAGDDMLEGGAGADVLEGENGDDVLYGDAGEDTLRGGEGDDSLFGGDDVDSLTGGPGADRYLLPTVLQDFFGQMTQFPEDSVTNVRDEDAVVYFSPGESQWITLLGEDFFYEGKEWFDDEIRTIDEALANLVSLTDNNALLKTADGGPITYYRYDDPLQFDDFTPTEVEAKYAAWNSNNGTMGFTNVVFDKDGDGVNDASDDSVHRTVYHEIAHFFDGENANWEEFKDLSGWSQSTEAVIQAAAGEKEFSGDGAWVHDDNEDLFVREYSKTNPYEDFATTFAYFVMNKVGENYGIADSTIADMGLKLDFMESFVQDLSNA